MISNKELKELYEFSSLEKENQNYLIKLNTKINRALTKPITKENKNCKLERKLREDLSRKYGLYSPTGKIGTTLLIEL
jgi:hypothetical protein